MRLLNWILLNLGTKIFLEWKTNTCHDLILSVENVIQGQSPVKLPRLKF